MAGGTAEALGQSAKPAGTAAASEYDLKLARLYSTLRYITWPDELTSANSPLVIGVIEPNPFGARLDKLVGRKLKNRPIEILTIESSDDYRPCHLLFISEDAPEEVVSQILGQTANHAVLVWCDEPIPELQKHTACTFVRQGDALLIEADPAELKRRNLIPEGQLLSLNIVRLVKSSNK